MKLNTQNHLIVYLLGFIFLSACEVTVLGTGIESDGGQDQDDDGDNLVFTYDPNIGPLRTADGDMNSAAATLIINHTATLNTNGHTLNHAIQARDINLSGAITVTANHLKFLALQGNNIHIANGSTLDLRGDNGANSTSIAGAAGSLGASGGGGGGGSAGDGGDGGSAGQNGSNGSAGTGALGAGATGHGQTFNPDQVDICDSDSENYCVTPGSGGNGGGAAGGTGGTGDLGAAGGGGGGEGN